MWMTQLKGLNHQYILNVNFLKVGAIQMCMPCNWVVLIDKQESLFLLRCHKHLAPLLPNLAWYTFRTVQVDCRNIICIVVSQNLFYNAT